MRQWIIAVGFTTLLQLPAAATELKPDVINAATFAGMLLSDVRINPLAVRVQVLLDKARFSPGEIDGRFGDNVEKAVRAFAEANGLPSGKVLTPEVWSKLQQVSGDPVIVEYTLTDQDVKGPFIDKLPSKLENKKSLKRLSYTSSKEALAEHFHMSEDLLAEINPGKKFDRVGDKINVANIPADKQSSKIARIEVDKGRETIRTFAQDGTLVAFYPASVGSEEKPTPSGTLKVVSIEPNPTYRYDPKYKFKGVGSTKPFTINPGPNNPVGTMWIGLSANGYGIHGTAEPSRVSKSESNGCIRLTNWDVGRLAKSVRKGVEVNFVEAKQASR
jgi:lipoprotein-anchoring transpeptidase ErfK/SrfK